MDIMTGEILSPTSVTTLVLIYWSILSSNRKGGDGVRGWIGGFVKLASCKEHFIRIDENMVQYPCYYTLLCIMQLISRC